MVNVSTICLALGGPSLPKLLSDFNLIFNCQSTLPSQPPNESTTEKYKDNLEKYTKEALSFKNTAEPKISNKEKHKNEKKQLNLNFQANFDSKSNFIFFSRRSLVLINFCCSFLQHACLDPLIASFIGNQNKALLLAVSGSKTQEIEDCRSIASSLNSNFIHSELHSAAFAQLTENRHANINPQRHIKLAYVQDLQALKHEPLRTYKVCVIVLNDKQTVFDAKYKKAILGLENDNLLYFEISEATKMIDYARFVVDFLLNDFVFTEKKVFAEELETFFTDNSKKY